MRFWWWTDTARLNVERQAVETLAAEVDWFELDRWGMWQGCLSADGTIMAHGHSYPVRLVYPDQFPLVPAWVEPRDDVRWSSHQYGVGGTLCLQLRPDNWDSGATGADMLRSAFSLLDIEDPLGGSGTRAPSGHAIGEVQSYAWDENPVLVGAGCLERLRTGLATDLKATSWSRQDLWPILLHDQIDRVNLRRPPDGDLARWRLERPIFVSRSPAPTGQTDRNAVVDAGGWEPEAAAWLLETKSAVVIFVGGDEAVAYNLMDDGATFVRKVFVLPDDMGVRSSRAAVVEGKRVVVVGCGSVGSKLAESILRSGVTTLTLVDGDVFLPANLERHVLDWDDVGFKKAGALKRRLLNIVPGAKIQAIEDNLNWQRSAKTHALQVDLISSGDIVVDATGDPATGLFLAAVAEANAKPFVSAQVYEGGIGALVATCIPDRDPPFVEGRARFAAWCELQDEPPPRSSGRRYEMLNDDGLPVVADDASVTMTAAHAARVVLDILDGNPPRIDDTWLLLGYREKWVFKGHGHNIKVMVGGRVPEVATPPDTAAREFVLSLVKEMVGEAYGAE